MTHSLFRREVAEAQRRRLYGEVGGPRARRAASSVVRAEALTLMTISTASSVISFAGNVGLRAPHEFLTHTGPVRPDPISKERAFTQI